MALLVLGAGSEVKGVKTIMHTKLCEGELKLDCVGLVKGDGTPLKGKCSQELKEKFLVRNLINLDKQVPFGCSEDLHSSLLN